MSRYSAWFRDRFRDSSFVFDAGEIGDNVSVTWVVFCSEGHPGVCKYEDQKWYRVYGMLAGRLMAWVNAELKIGDLFCVTGSSGEGVLREIYLIPGYIRLRDPKIIVFVELTRAGNMFSLTCSADADDGELVAFAFLYPTQLAKRLVPPCTIVEARKVSFTSAEHSCGEVSFAAEGDVAFRRTAQEGGGPCSSRGSC